MNINNQEKNIFAVGDSHSIFYSYLTKIKHHWVGWWGMPVTIHKLIEEGLPLYNIVDPGDKSNTNVKENDIVLFCYGWNDVQKNIYKYAKDNYENEINNLVKKYVELIQKYSKGKIIVVNQKEIIEPEEELVKDVMSILNVYVAKMNGLRKYNKVYKTV